jgi:hypothetical protein
METTSAALAAPTANLCPHLINDGLNQPMALTAFDDQMSYACPSCVVDRVESAIGTGNIAPIPHHINLRRCDHNPYRDGDDVACWPCLEALKSELKMRWARAFITGERHRANKLRQVANDLALLNDRKANLLPDLTTHSPAWAPTRERYPGEFKRDDQIRRERCAARLPTKPKPQSTRPAIYSAIPALPVRAREA